MYSRWLSNLRSPHVMSELYFSVSVCGGWGGGGGCLCCLVLDTSLL